MIEEATIKASFSEKSPQDQTVNTCPPVVFGMTEMEAIST